MFVDYEMSIVCSVIGNKLVLLLLEIQTCHVLIEVGLGEFKGVKIG